MKHGLCFLLVLAALAVAGTPAQAELRVGAAAMDVTPENFPVLINGGFMPRTGEPKDIYARAIVVDDGQTRIALVVTDSCMLPKDLVDGAKQLAAERTQIPPERIMISATHTHTAPSAMGALGTPADETYVPYLRIKLADAIIAAEKNLQPAQVGWGSIDAAEFTALRRWILRPDQMRTDPFGNLTVRASMHTARDNLPNVTGESGPEDPELAIISFQTPGGEPLALLANFSMHYYGGGGAADYFGAYCKSLEEKLGQTAEGKTPFVAVMSHGCSGDIWRHDYRNGTDQTFDGYVDGMVAKTLEALEGVEYSADADLAMAETRMTMKYRVPDEARLTWARKIIEEMNGRDPKTQTEVYALEQVILHERQATEIVLQAIRIGDIAIATTPNETYALTGLKLKRQSPLEKTMVIELANGGDGYIPPPEQHVLGGYNTWEARSAGLEVTAEPKIVEADLQLLEKVCGQPRRPLTPPSSELAQTIVEQKPARYYPLDDMAGPIARDASGNERHATFEDGVVFYLEGPEGKRTVDGDTINRAAQFAGGRIASRAAELKDDFSISLWCYNGLVPEARDLCGWMVSRDHAHNISPSGIHLGLAGQGDQAGKLVLQLGEDQGGRSFGNTPLERWQWYHVTLVYTQGKCHVYLDGQEELSAEAKLAGPLSDDLFFGGRSDNQDNWEGRLDEIAVFARALSPEEIAQLARRDSDAQVASTETLSEVEKTQGGRHWVDDETPPPLSPEESHAAFEIEPGYKVELVAAEPLVKDPVAIVFDQRGRMFVAEYGDYPIGPEEEGAKPLSRIVWLEDTDGDGQMDRRHVFADGLNFCHSLMPYRGGILACAQTEVIWLQDTDGDGRADKHEVLLSGFQPAHPQMQIGVPQWGWDNQIYFNYGIGKVTDGQTTVDIPRTEFRYDPQTGQFGPASGTGQYGNTITAWGDRLFGSNRNPIIHAPLTHQQLRQNPFHTISTAQYDVAPSGGQSKVYPLVAMKSNWLSHAGTHTSACGTTAYIGDGLGSGMVDSVFACEPIGHLVTRAIVERQGTTLSSTRAREEADFLASRDTWFRPSSLANGPDGMLYLADMYRLWVEHPKFLPPEIAAKLDWRAGEDRGRIWRIVPENRASRPPFQTPRTTQEMVALLEDTNGWRRFLGQRMLVEDQRTEAAPALGKLLAESDFPLARWHALGTLVGLNAAKAEHFEKALADTEPRIRASAVHAAAGNLADKLGLWPTIVELADDEDTYVRFQVALALGQSSHPDRAAALAKLAARDGNDSWMASAILSSAATCSAEIALGLPIEADVPGDLVERLAQITGTRGEAQEIDLLLQGALRPELASRRANLLIGLAEGLPRRPSSQEPRSLAALLQELPQQRQQIESEAIGQVLDPGTPLAVRQQGVALLAKLPPLPEAVVDTLLEPGQPIPLQLSLVAALGQSLTVERAQPLLAAWPVLSPQVRSQALSQFLRRTPTAAMALEAISSGTLERSLVTLEQQKALLTHRDEKLRGQAEQIFGAPASDDRAAVLDAYKRALTTIGSPRAGQLVYQKSCAKCHAADQVTGKRVGPDLADSQNRPREALLYDILDPSGKVEPRHAAYQVLTVDGQAFSGLIITETSATLVLQLADGKEETIARDEIDILKASEKSLMPEGLEKEISQEEMANLLEFLKSPLSKG